MPCVRKWATLVILTITPVGASVASAGDPGRFMGYYAYPQPVMQSPDGRPIAYGSQSHSAAHANYDVQLGAPPMYVSPQPGIPSYTGGTIITNPAFDPHEMLYAHKYRALYPPYYYKVNVDGFQLPLIGGPVSHRVRLIGTEVNVNYRSYRSPISLFFPPK